MPERKVQEMTEQDVMDVADQLRQLANKYERVAETMQAPINDKHPRTLQVALDNLDIHLTRIQEA